MILLASLINFSLKTTEPPQHPLPPLLFCDRQRTKFFFITFSRTILSLFIHPYVVHLHRKVTSQKDEGLHATRIYNDIVTTITVGLQTWQKRHECSPYDMFSCFQKLCRCLMNRMKYLSFVCRSVISILNVICIWLRLQHTWCHFWIWTQISSREDLAVSRHWRFSLFLERNPLNIFRRLAI